MPTDGEPGDSDMLVDLLKPHNADKILIKIADLGNACWVVSDGQTTQLWNFTNLSAKLFKFC